MGLENPKILAVVGWRRTDAAGIRDANSLRYERYPAVGMVGSDIDDAWSGFGELEAEEELDFDLTALPYNAFGDHVRAFGSLRAVMVINRETETGAILQVGGASSPLEGLFLDSGDGVKVGEDGCLLLGGGRTHILVESGASQLRLKNLSDTFSLRYYIALLGTGTDIPLPAAKTMEEDPRFIYADNGSFDVGLCGVATYAVNQMYWGGSAAISWYAFWHEKQGTTYCTPSVNNNVLTGLPAAQGIWSGTVARLKENLVDSPLIGFYFTLFQIATEAGLNLTTTSTWPRTRPLWDAEWDALSPPPSSWTNSDIDPGGIGNLGKRLDLANADARELSAVKNAEIIQAAKLADPDINFVFSDNGSIIAGATSWGQQMDTVGRFLEKISSLGVGLVLNTTSGSYTGELGSLPTSGDLTDYWDLAAEAGGTGMMAFYNEGCTNAHQLRVDNTLANGKNSYESAIDNLTNWLARSWPGGGRRGILSEPASAMDGLPSNGVFWGLNRRCVVIAATVIDSFTIELECATEHYLADTSNKRCVPQNVHASVNGLDFEPDVQDEVTFRITKSTAHGIGSFSLTANSGIGFPFSGPDVDFGWLHANRLAGDFTLVKSNPNSAAVPLWLDDITTFGVCVPGSLEVVSTHIVNIGTSGSPVNRECVKELKYQFASGPSDERWHHLDLSIEGRRRWRAAS